MPMAMAAEASMTTPIRRLSPTRRASSTPPMLAAIATRPLSVATVVGARLKPRAGCRLKLNTRKATSHERMANSSQLCAP